MLTSLFRLTRFLRPVHGLRRCPSAITRPYHDTNAGGQARKRNRTLNRPSTALPFCCNSGSRTPSMLTALRSSASKRNLSTWHVMSRIPQCPVLSDRLKLPTPEHFKRASPTGCMAHSVNGLVQPRYLGHTAKPSSRCWKSQLHICEMRKSKATSTGRLAGGMVPMLPYSDHQTAGLRRKGGKTFRLLTREPRGSEAASRKALRRLAAITMPSTSQVIQLSLPIDWINRWPPTFTLTTSKDRHR
jgi:hypothetical protein